MASRSIYPSIPAPGTDAASLRATVDAMRQTLTMITLNAQTPNPNFTPSSSAQVFVTRNELQSLSLVGQTGQQGPPGEQGPQGPPGVSGLPDAPNDGTLWARKNELWSPVPVVTTSLPLMDGTAAIGSSGDWADGDHVHPTDTSRLAADSPVFNTLPSNFANDAAAATGGIPLKGVYRNGSVLMVRVT